jgi:hypothetical protein
MQFGSRLNPTSQISIEKSPWSDPMSRESQDGWCKSRFSPVAQPNANFQFACGSTAIGLFNILDSDSKPGVGIEAIGDR